MAQTLESPHFHSHVQVRGGTPSTPPRTKEGLSPESGLEPLSTLGGKVVEDLEYILTSPLRIDTRSALILGSVGAGIGGFMLFDDEIRDAFQDNRRSTRDDIANALEIAGSSYTFFAGHLGLIAGGLWFRENKAGDKLLRAALVSLEAQVFTEATAGFIKIAAGRRRPNHDRGTYSFAPFQDFTFDRSFPSSHTARAFAVAAVFSEYYPQPVPFLTYSAAALIGLSRIYLDEHFSSDVFAGAALGLAMGKALSWHHQHNQGGWMVLPMFAGKRGGFGLTLHVPF